MNLKGGGHIKAIVEDILDVVKAFELIDFSFIPRNFNRDAHLFAKLCFESDEDFVWTGVFPDWLSGIRSAV